MAEIIFPAGITITISSQPVPKPWGAFPPDAFRCEVLNPLPVTQLIDTLNALWTAHNALSVSIAFAGEERADGRGKVGAFFVKFAPEVGFTDADGAQTYTEIGLRELVEAHYAAARAA